MANGSVNIHPSDFFAVCLDTPFASWKANIWKELEKKIRKELANTIKLHNELFGQSQLLQEVSLPMSVLVFHCREGQLWVGNPEPCTPR